MNNNNNQRKLYHRRFLLDFKIRLNSLIVFVRDDNIGWL